MITIAIMRTISMRMMMTTTITTTKITENSNHGKKRYKQIIVVSLKGH